MLATLPLHVMTRFPALRRNRLETLQVNLCYRCNQQCLHCHVNAGPRRTELMGHETVEQILAFLRASRVSTLDITGGAPELNPHFRELVRAARDAGTHVIDRCNLSVLAEPGLDDFSEFLAARGGGGAAARPGGRRGGGGRRRGK